jgi:hypothetical protein
MPEHAPDKPAFGATCNGCGLCCAVEVCRIGQMAFGDVPAPCPGLTFVQGRFWCQLVLAEQQAQGLGVVTAPRLAEALAIGRGCDAEDDDTRATPCKEEEPWTPETR